MKNIIGVITYKNTFLRSQTHFRFKAQMSSTRSDSFHGNPEAAAGSPLHESPGDSNLNPQPMYEWYGQYHPVAHGWYGQYHPVAPSAHGWCDQYGQYHPVASPMHYYPPPNHTTVRLSATASAFKPPNQSIQHRMVHPVEDCDNKIQRKACDNKIQRKARGNKIRRNKAHGNKIRRKGRGNRKPSLESQSCSAYHALETLAKRNMDEGNWSTAAELFQKTIHAREVHHIRFELVRDQAHISAIAFCADLERRCLKKVLTESRSGAIIVR